MKLLLMFSLLMGLFPVVVWADSLESDYHTLGQQINSVTEKPMRLQRWSNLWVEHAVLTCLVNAKLYNIEPGRCPSYIRAKVAGCYHHVEKDLSVFIVSRKQGLPYISDFYECISAWPHCNGREIRSLEDLKQCRNR